MLSTPATSLPTATAYPTNRRHSMAGEPRGGVTQFTAMTPPTTPPVDQSRRHSVTGEAPGGLSQPVALASASTPPVVYRGRRHSVAGDPRRGVLRSGAGGAKTRGVRWDASLRKGRTGNQGAAVASPATPVGKGFARNANFGRRMLWLLECAPLPAPNTRSQRTSLRRRHQPGPTSAS